MTRDQSISRAQDRARRFGRTFMVTSRSEHPMYLGQIVYLVFPKSAKYAWAPDERLLFDTDHPDDFTAAWYAADCPPYGAAA